MLLLALAAHATEISAQRVTSDTARAPRGDDVVLPDAHSFILPDARTQIAYRIYVALPQGYANGTKRYPVLFVLDAEGVFALATQAYRLLRLDSITPDLILVGIGYDLAGTARRKQRMRDLTPTRIASDTATGGSASFLRFVAQTLIPTIDARYRTDTSERAIVGHSLGGLFALYALLEQPTVFRRYIVSSPSLWWDDGVIFRYESRLARTKRIVKKSVFMSVGSEEPADMRDHFQPFADSIRSRGYVEFVLTAAVLPGETHLTAFPASFLRGIRTIYELRDRSG